MDKFKVSIERGGKTYTGTATVSGGTLTVSSPALSGSKSAVLHSPIPDMFLAERLLNELVDDSERRQ